MRLINVNTRKLEECLGDPIPRYAILSHTWEVEEVTFADYQSGHFKHLEGYAKIDGACRQAKADRLTHIWVDTCCIDKSSSSELSEAINSMFQWYANSHICYAYLSDVQSFSDVRKKRFAESRWFTRGWTLQELLAPLTVEFYGRAWQYLGSKSELCNEIQLITRIDTKVLRDPGRIKGQSISTRMSWAARRETTRIEDIAYCLLGLFDISMPLLYGEGNKAFIRLQYELLRASGDHSLLAWGYDENAIGDMSAQLEETDLLASSPSDFARGAEIVCLTNRSAASRMSLVNEGLLARIPVIAVDSIIKGGLTIVLDEGPNCVTVEEVDCPGYIAILACRCPSMPAHFIGLLCSLTGWTESPMDQRLDMIRTSLRTGASTILVPASIAAQAIPREICIQQKRMKQDYGRGEFGEFEGDQLVLIDKGSAESEGLSIEDVYVHEGIWSQADGTLYPTSFSCFALVKLKLLSSGHTTVLGLSPRDQKQSLWKGNSPSFAIIETLLEPGTGELVEDFWGRAWEHRNDHGDQYGKKQVIFLKGTAQLVEQWCFNRAIYILQFS